MQGVVAPSTPTSRQEKMLQQRQLALKRQKELALKRQQPQLMAHAGAMAAPNALHQKKADGWAKIFVDPSLFEQPSVRPSNATPEPTGAAATPVAASAEVQKTPPPTEHPVTPATSQAQPPRPTGALGYNSESGRRPQTVDSTETDVLDNVPAPPRLKNEMSDVSLGRQGAVAPAPGQERSDYHREYSDDRAPGGVGGGWDLQVEEVNLNAGAAGKDKNQKGRNFWKPWKGAVRVNSGPLVSDDVVESIDEVFEGFEDMVPHDSKAVDSRISTPWAPVQEPQVEEGIQRLPGVMEEEIDRRPIPTRPVARAGPMPMADDIDDIDDL